VRRGLTALDCRFMKLDCGDEKTFCRFNRSHPSISLMMILDGLKSIDNIIIQSLFAGGETGNSDDYSIDSWIEKIAYIKPLVCHIYSLDRPSPDKNLIKLSQEYLLAIKEKTEHRTSIRVDIF
jgi:wyosine [tRNA(Phe)-imidazoG37] synthetase (radical SAM superfamily)